MIRGCGDGARFMLFDVLLDLGHHGLPHFYSVPDISTPQAFPGFSDLDPEQMADLTGILGPSPRV